MFAYCGNNPISRIDPYGASWWGDFWTAAHNWLEEKKDEASQNHDGTISYGVTFSLGYAISGTGTVGLTWDKKGNFGLLRSVSIGEGSPNASAAVYGTATNAPTIFHQGGEGYVLGASTSGTVISTGVDYNLLIDSGSGDYYHGGTVSVGAGVPLPAEVHVEYATTVINGFNIFNLGLGAVDLLNRVGEWAITFVGG